MNRICRILIPLFVVITLQSFAFASQEGVLGLSNFSVKSEGVGNSGYVQVSGTINKERAVASLRIEAFGKDYSLLPEDLTKIPKGFYNGIQLSYEEGYKQLGGKTVYIILQMGFVSGMESRVLVTFTESGSVEIEVLDTEKN